jgi:hypothetical protein
MLFLRATNEITARVQPEFLRQLWAQELSSNLTEMAVAASEDERYHVYYEVRNAHFVGWPCFLHLRSLQFMLWLRKK